MTPEQKLEEAYFEGLCKGHLFAEDGNIYMETINSVETASYEERLGDLETVVYGKALGASEMNRTYELRTAKKRWDALAASPLYKALE